MSAAAQFPENHFKVKLIVLFIIQTIVASFAILKIVVTQRNRKNVIPFLEDWLLLFAIATAYGALGVIFVETYNFNLGLHLKDVRFGDILVNCRLLFASALITIWTHGLLRLSLLVSVRRLYSPIKTRMQLVCDILLVGQVCATIASSFWAIFANPLHPAASWNMFVALKYKVNPVEATLGICIIGLVGDCFILCSPLPLLFKLKNLTTRRRNQISALLFFCFLTISVSIVRVAEGLHIRKLLGSDLTWYFPIFIIVSQVEVTLATITVSLPTASIFFRWVYAGQQRVITTTQRSHPLRACSSYIVSTVDEDDGKTSTITSTTITPHQSTEINTDAQEISETQLHMSSHDTASLHRLSSISKVSSHCSIVQNTQEVDEEEEEDDGNFFEMLVPSDRFYPAATVLKPRPAAV